MGGAQICTPVPQYDILEGFKNYPSTGIVMKIELIYCAA